MICHYRERVALSGFYQPSTDPWPSINIYVRSRVLGPQAVYIEKTTSGFSVGLKLRSLLSEPWLPLVVAESETSGAARSGTTDCGFRSSRRQRRACRDGQQRSEEAPRPRVMCRFTY
ncbi:hypothetical protein EVAR_92260_1 [Eumeta japonica]|uniref:Uncharacterized protein n=1 Tax=Eumeta variegata TaxID=151549 RepID=A0A4C1TM20_EUMVA|nr:hypothetical protein EVAR_92260_1 [Eumeta japonica]